jgi:hypothetical protein
MYQEEFLQHMLAETYTHETIAIYDVARKIAGNSDIDFVNTRPWTHQLVREKLAVYADEERTTLRISNYGRYWMLHGGYEAYLRECFDLKEKKNAEKEQQKLELLEERLKLTQYRLVGFWLTLVLSIIGMLSLALNLYLLLSKNK